MKKLLFLLVFFLPFLASGENFMKEGMKWDVRTNGTHQPENAGFSYTTVSIDKANDGGTELLGFYRTESGTPEPKLTGYMKTEGEKVFFRPLTADTDWYLIYDFGLNPGEGATVYEAESLIDNELRSTYIKCTEIKESEVFNNQEIMMLEEYPDESCTSHADTGIWIKGVSSVMGVLYNNRFGVDGIGRTLMKAYDGDKVIYEYDPAGAGNITDSDECRIQLEGMTVTVTASTPQDAMLYSNDGILLKKLQVSAQPSSFTLPQKGIYILRAGKQSHRLIAR